MQHPADPPYDHSNRQTRPEAPPGPACGRTAAGADMVPDTRRPGFAAECRRQSLSLAADAAARADEAALDALLEQVADTDGWR